MLRKIDDGDGTDDPLKRRALLIRATEDNSCGFRQFSDAALQVCKTSERGALPCGPNPSIPVCPAPDLALCGQPDRRNTLGYISKPQVSFPRSISFFFGYKYFGLDFTESPDLVLPNIYIENTLTVKCFSIYLPS